MHFVKNEYGSSHPEATLLEGVEGKQTGVIQGVKKIQMYDNDSSKSSYTIKSSPLS